ADGGAGEGPTAGPAAAGGGAAGRRAGGRGSTRGCRSGGADTGRSGSSTRRRMDGGTTRPFGRAGSCAAAGAAAWGMVSVEDSSAAGAAASAGAAADGSVTAAAGTASGAGSATGVSAGAGAGVSTAVGACSSTGGAGGVSTTSRASTGAGGSAGGSDGGAGGGTGGRGAAVLDAFTRRGGGRVGPFGASGTAGLPPFLLERAVAASLNIWLGDEGSAMLRFRAWRSTNWRATTSSIVLEALFTSMPASERSRSMTSWLVVFSSSATL